MKCYATSKIVPPRALSRYAGGMYPVAAQSGYGFYQVLKAIGFCDVGIRP